MTQIKLLHGTSSALLDSIKIVGLVPPIYSNIITNEQTKSKDSVYLTEEYEYAKRFAELAVSKFGGEKIILVVNINLEELLVDEDVLTELLDEDENGYYFTNEDNNKYYTKKEIENLTGLESLNIDQKCRYKGIIKPEMICHIEKC